MLERAGLVRRTVHGRRHVCRLDAQPLAEVARHLRFYEQFWAGGLDALEAFVTPATTPTAETGTGSRCTRTTAASTPSRVRT